ncbi:hypothetical protein MMQ12_02625, partial [Klebsiella pneumoniae]|nr:hypothetical protein [Klebsiella pneumoniae]
GMVCVVGRMRDLILQLSKSSIYSTKPLMSDTARAPYPTNLSGRNVKNEHVDDRKNKSRQAIYRYVRRLT